MAHIIFSLHELGFYLYFFTSHIGLIAPILLTSWNQLITRPFTLRIGLKAHVFLFTMDQDSWPTLFLSSPHENRLSY